MQAMTLWLAEYHLVLAVVGALVVGFGVGRLSVGYWGKRWKREARLYREKYSELLSVRDIDPEPPKQGVRFKVTRKKWEKAISKPVYSGDNVSAAKRAYKEEGLEVGAVAEFWDRGVCRARRVGE